MSHRGCCSPAETLPLGLVHCPFSHRRRQGEVDGSKAEAEGGGRE